MLASTAFGGSVLKANMTDVIKQSELIRHERIKAELRIRSTSLAEIARALGVSGTSLSLVSMGKHRSKRIEKAIAEALGENPEELWPERYSKGA